MTMVEERPSPRCAGCGRVPADIPDLVSYLEPGQTADEYVREEEGTFDPATGAFLCDYCYVRAGQPSGAFPHRWTATPANLAALGL